MIHLVKIRFLTLTLCLMLSILGFSGLAAISPLPVKASGSNVKTFHLYATDGYITMPDGKPIYVWGYSLKNEKGTAQYPAPALEVNEGDEVEVTLTNIGPKKEGIKLLAHTIHFHGLDTDQADDGVPHTSAAIQVGESFTYHFKADHAGTYFYHCHVDTIEHLQMGMFGAFVVKAKDGVNQAWTGGPAYDKEYTFVLNEIDPVWHKAVEDGQPYDRTDFHPRYWTINGKAYPDTEQSPDTLIEAKVGEKVLIRLINSGYSQHAFHMHGQHFMVIASDGRPLPEPLEKDTLNIGQGERYDILVTMSQVGMFPFHSHNIVDNTNDGVYPGGLHTMVHITANDQTTIVLKAGDTHVQVDGKDVMLEVAPKLIGETTYVPLRFIGNQLGAGITWIQEEQSAVYTTDKAKIQLWIDQNRAVVNGKEITLETPPIIEEGNTLVPLRFVTENLGAALQYNPETKEITLTGKRGSTPPDSGTHDHPDSGTGSISGTGSGDSSMPPGHQHDGQTTPPSPPAEQDKTSETVTIKDSVFSVKELHVKLGTKVTWVNLDQQIHTVIELKNLFNSGNMLMGDKFSYTFTKPGTYTYYCSTHPSMEAKVIVEP